MRYEDSPADKAADRREAKKRGMTAKEWEGSPADKRMDAKAEKKPKKKRLLKRLLGK